jgi:hypothetical protein
MVPLNADQVTGNGNGQKLTLSSIRVIATNMAQKRGETVRVNLGNRPERRRDLGKVALKHNAALFPAIQSVKNAIPANAPEECPEGKDFLPLYTDFALLNRESSVMIWFRIERYNQPITSLEHCIPLAAGKKVGTQTS